MAYRRSRPLLSSYHGLVVLKLLKIVLSFLIYPQIMGGNTNMFKVSYKRAKSKVSIRIFLVATLYVLMKTITILTQIWQFLKLRTNCLSQILTNCPFLCNKVQTLVKMVKRSKGKMRSLCFPLL